MSENGYDFGIGTNGKPYVPTENEMACYLLIRDNPVLKWHLTELINDLKNMVESCLDEMQEHHIDTVDRQIKLAKRGEPYMRVLGIPCIKSAQDWRNWHEEQP